MKINSRDIFAALGTIIFLIALFLVSYFVDEGKAISYKPTYSSTKPEEFIYLSDIKYDDKETKLNNIYLDKNQDDESISLVINEKNSNLLKGIFVEANSTLVYDISEYEYDYLTTYLGVNSFSKNNDSGVEFYIYTSNDANNWYLKKSSKVLKDLDEAEYVKVSLKDAKYIKLVVNQIDEEAGDYAIYGNAKLIMKDYEDDMSDITVLESKEENITDQDFIPLKEHFAVKIVGYSLESFVSNISNDKDKIDSVNNSFTNNEEENNNVNQNNDENEEIVEDNNISENSSIDNNDNFELNESIDENNNFESNESIYDSNSYESNESIYDNNSYDSNESIETNDYVSDNVVFEDNSDIEDFDTKTSSESNVDEIYYNDNVKKEKKDEKEEKFDYSRIIFITVLALVALVIIW